MGSVTVFFILPFMLIGMFFSSLFGAITGNDRTKVELPYDEAKGLIWECEEDANWFSVINTEIEGDKQIFTFKGSSSFGTDETIYDEFEVVFTAKNGEEIVYIAEKDDDYFGIELKVKMYSPDEYDMITYTPEANIPVEGAEWYATGSSELYKAETVDGKNTFTFVYLPDGDGKTRFSDELKYMSKDKDNSWQKHERIILEVVLENGKAIIRQDYHEYYVDYSWTKDKPVTGEAS